ncbi:hypothetical protein AAMO2058_001737000 [Amorphochlora amoebiformis]|uniref:Roadblock/LAMTOR2 domain-containing protein n=2 Tax=Amorphochlora amoebiformis TaxID=1561963 RepID=A0A7S0DMM7_9EUKA|mmetsp:Transcript_32414/g.52231  ORF Transcript_32414/g.52231 Transcript_32414/m.52231 type:complete len:154 (+) Transcript_32414:206-667(+)
MICCCPSEDVKGELHTIIQQNFRSVGKIFGNTAFICIMTLDSKIVAERQMGAGQANSSSPVDVIEQMGSLKKAAENFGSILHCSKCPVIHIKGNNQIFSCYDLWGHNILVFSSYYHRAIASSFNTAGADNQMKAIVASLSAALEQLDKIDKGR